MMHNDNHGGQNDNHGGRNDNHVSIIFWEENVGGQLLRTCNHDIGRVPGKYPRVHLVGSKFLFNTVSL